MAHAKLLSGIAVATALCLALAGCVASSARYPSLERVPAERLAVAPPGPPPADPASDPAASADLARRIAQLVDQAHGAQGDFAGKQALAERAIAGSGAQGSESWARASIAMAQLDEAHGPVVQALAQLDQLEVDNRTRLAGAENADTTAIVTARDQVAIIADAQAAVLARLRNRLP